jgi:hypothetical protein
MNTRVIEINTTAFSEENFYLLTSLSDEQIKSVLAPIVRSGESDYDNYDLVNALTSAYPNEVIEMHLGFDTLSI